MPPDSLQCPVWSVNEWDPLEEVVVGTIAGAAAPVYHKVIDSIAPPDWVEKVKAYDDERFPPELVEAAENERQEFIRILQGEGVTVREPAEVDFTRIHATPFWQSRGWCAACPRDSVLVIGNELIEAPMSWRARYFETMAFRPLLLDYFRQGAKWTAAPKPQLLESLYDYDYRAPLAGEPMRYVINESEPLFDAADFMRFGNDILALRSNSCNEAGITWLERHLGPAYRVHRVKSHFRQPMHLDDHLMPLAPGRLLISPEYIRKEELPEFLQSWEILEAPRPEPVGFDPFYSEDAIAFFWLNVNVLALGHGRVIVEASQKATIRALKDWGFEPIPCHFANYISLGGVFHCATIDIRRRPTT